MDTLTRSTRGGVGAAVFALGLAAAAVVAGWAAGAGYDGWRGSAACAATCDGVVAGIAATPAPTFVPDPTPVPEPTPLDPDGFPYVSAQSVAVIEGSCGALIYGRDEHRRFPPASLTKLMTAAVAVDQAPLSTLITSHVDGAEMAARDGSTIMGLTPGMQLSLEDLLYGLLLPSGNDAAIAIAEGVGGGEAAFVELMNEKAASLALDDSHFTNPHGLDDAGLYSSAHDMAILARYVMQNADLRTIVQSLSWQPRWDGPEIGNGNELLVRYDGADGVKIGNTEEAQQTIVGSASRGGRRIIVSLMRSQDRYQDSARLFDWAFAQPSACP